MTILPKILALMKSFDGWRLLRGGLAIAIADANGWTTGAQAFAIDDAQGTF
jgi:hypothetical protein